MHEKNENYLINTERMRIIIKYYCLIFGATFELFMKAFVISVLI